ncbi:NAD(P)H-hydrate dehydratase [Candidatus Desantisbacteria bacterium]|nr:NAD(P)H-hydrate dehydratase [Candidatus Desantisbacteria bacterium]
MKIVTREQMQEIDRITAVEYGISGAVLMENAGIQAFLAIKEYFCLQQVEEVAPLAGARIAVLCGSGNNGGDGFVVARHLFNHGARVKIYLLVPEEKVKGDARINLEAARGFGVPIQIITSCNELNALTLELKHARLIVDALLGTGASGDVKGLFAEIIDIVNTLDIPVIAIDIPSGLDANTGMSLGHTVRATMTVTFGLPKLGLVMSPGIEYTGKLLVANISFPQSLLEQENIRINLLTSEDMACYIPHHPVDAHKGLCGKAFILAGSTGMTGAAALCSESALRIGSGLVTLGIPESLNHLMEVKLTEVMTMPLPQTFLSTFSQQGYEKIMSFCEDMDIVALGPGIGRDEDTKRLVQRLILHLRTPMVIDADALFAIALQTDILKHKNAPAVITPHPGEMAYLIGCTVKDVLDNRIDIVQKFAEEHDTTVVLKGARTIIADPSGHIWINPTGNCGMATAGCGDVLTGMISGLIAQGLSVPEAARLGVFLHGLAGDIKAEEKGMLSLIASDVLGGVSEAIKQATNCYMSPQT